MVVPETTAFSVVRVRISYMAAKVATTAPAIRVSVDHSHVSLGQAGKNLPPAGLHQEASPRGR